MSGLVKMCEQFCPEQKSAKIKNLDTGDWFQVTGNLDMNNGMFGVWSSDSRNHLYKVIGEDASNLWIEIDGIDYRIISPWDDVDMVAKHIFKRDTTQEAGSYKIMVFFTI